MAKSVLWDPSGGSSRFVVGGTSELRMYEWEVSSTLARATGPPADDLPPQHTRTTSRLHTRSVCSELSQLRTFDWAPHPSYADLLAVGLTTGRTLLLRLDASASPSASHTANADHRVSALQLNVRHSRPCNVVAFGIGHPGLLAVGLEKGRGESLLVFDIEQSAKSLDGGATTARTVPAIHHSLPPQAPRASSPASSEARPLYQFGSSETVTSACFLVPDGGSASSSPLLVAGMGQKSLRAFDLRNGGGNAVSMWGTRSLSGIVANPFNGQQFASFGEDGSIKVWDLRKPVEALLSFSESDAGSVKSNTRGRSTLVGGNRALAEVAWSRTRMGVLTSLEVDSTTVRVWNIAEGAIAKVEPMDEGTLRTVASKKLDGRELRLPILLSDAQRTSTHISFSRCID
jgi:WD40 repeat protein